MYKIAPMFVAATVDSLHDDIQGAFREVVRAEHALAEALPAATLDDLLTQRALSTDLLRAQIAVARLGRLAAGRYVGG